MKNIKDLLQKYFDGATSLEEEQALKTYFSTPNIDPADEKYRALFQYLAKEKQKTLSDAVAEKIEQKIAPPPVSKSFWTTSTRNWLTKVAAVVGISGGLFLATQKFAPTDLSKPVATNTTIDTHFEDTEESPEIALEKAKAALELLSRKMKKGKDVAANSLAKVKKSTDIIEVQ